MYLFSIEQTLRTDFDDILPLTVYEDGTVVWSYPAVVKTPCALDMALFPWDVQTCDLEFESWASESSYLSLATNNTLVE